MASQTQRYVICELGVITLIPLDDGVIPYPRGRVGGMVGGMEEHTPGDKVIRAVRVLINTP